jgi:hypothetical protein
MVDLEGEEVYTGHTPVTYTTASGTNKSGGGGDELAII